MGVVGFAEAPVNLTRRGLSDEILKLQEGIWHSHSSVLACVISACSVWYLHFCRLLSWPEGEIRDRMPVLARYFKLLN